MTRAYSIGLLALFAASSALADAPTKGLLVTLRTRVQPFKGANEWQEAASAPTTRRKGSDR